MFNGQVQQQGEAIRSSGHTSCWGHQELTGNQAGLEKSWLLRCPWEESILTKMGPGYISCTFETGPKVHKSSPFMQPLLNFWLDTPCHSYQKHCPEQTCAGADPGTWKMESGRQAAIEDRRVCFRIWWEPTTWSPHGSGHLRVIWGKLVPGDSSSFTHKYPNLSSSSLYM